MKYNFKHAGILAALLICASSSQATLTIFTGENQTPGEMVSGAPLTARNAFLSNLTGVGTETFESQAVGAEGPLALTFPGSGSTTLGAALIGDGVVFPTPSTAGRFNTTGATAGPTPGQWWSVEGNFYLVFDQAISAFGFYGTDIGDFNGQLLIKLTDTNDVVTELEVPHTINGADGSLLFWGFIDTSNSYKRIDFGNTAQGVDFFGFDDMTIGDARQINPPPNPTPEPGMLALLGVAGLAASMARRRRDRRAD